jgi:hypothetical protein
MENIVEFRAKRESEGAGEREKIVFSEMERGSEWPT